MSRLAPFLSLLVLAGACGQRPAKDADTAADADADTDSDTDTDTDSDTDTDTDTDSDTDTDTDTDCDPTVASIDIPDMHGDFELLHTTISPAAIDPASDHYPQSHHTLMFPTDASVTLRDELFIMLPGTSNQGEGFDLIAEIAARAGYPVLVLAYDSEFNHAEACMDVPLDDMMACRTAAIEEKIYGDDVSAYVDIDEPNSLVGRALRVLRAVDAEYPDARVDRYLDGDDLAWENIVLAGFSQGAVMTGFLSGEHEVARAVLLAGGCDSMTTEGGDVILADWCTAARATPAERTYALSHLMDEPAEDAAIHEAFGLTAFGDYADAGTESPSYCTDTHLLGFTLDSADAPYNSYHLATAHDQSVPVDGDGVPLLAEDYYYLFAGP